MGETAQQARNRLLSELRQVRASALESDRPDFATAARTLGQEHDLLAEGRRENRRRKNVAARSSREDLLAREIGRLDDAIEQATAGGSWVAAMKGSQLLVQLHGELEALRAQSQDPFEVASEDELLAVVVEAIGALPDKLLDSIAEAIAQRRPGIRVVK